MTAKIIFLPVVPARRAEPDPAIITAIASARDVAAALQGEAVISMSKHQWMERICLQRAGEAKDPDAARAWRNQADWIAMSMKTSQLCMPALPHQVDGPETRVDPIQEQPSGYDPRRRPVTLLPWILVALGIAAAIAVTPAEWFL